MFTNYDQSLPDFTLIHVNFCKFPQRIKTKKTKLLIYIIFYLRKLKFLIQIVLRKITSIYLLLPKLT